MPPLDSSFADVKFSLNAWGVAGIFGGEEAISAMALVPLHQGRRWLGWYNAPGSLGVARRFGHLAQCSHFWKRIFPYTNATPATLFAFDGEKGPRYTAALSGTEMQTGHLGYLTMERCKDIQSVTEVKGRKTSPVPVAVINLGEVADDDKVPRLPKLNAFLAFIPIVISVMACVMCALASEWYCFSVILFGILASGFATMAIGSGRLMLKAPKAAPGSPRGDGSLVCDEIVVVVKGTENAVNVITKGKFILEHQNTFLQHAIGVCSLLLILEFLAQLFLIPQGTLFGQLMFVISLCVSWLYTFYISSIRRERLQANVLFKKLGDPPIHKFLLGTRTTMALFVTLLVFHGASNPTPDSVETTLRTFLPNKTLVWERWVKKATRQVRDKSLSYLELEDGDEDGLTDSDKELLHTLLEDACSAYEGYRLYVKQS